MAVNGRVVRVTIGDDHDVRRTELRWALQAAGARVVAEAVTPAEILRLSLRHQPDLVVVDPHVGTEAEPDLVSRLLLRVPASHVVSGGPSNGYAAGVGERLHVVRGLVPGHVVTTMRCLTWSTPRPAATAVVCVADPRFRAAVVAALSDDGVATVDEVPGSAEAYRAVHDLGPDLLVMDLSLTGMGGWRYLRRLSQHHPDCRIVVTSPLGGAPPLVDEGGVAALLAEGDIGGLRSAVRALLVPDQDAGTRAWLGDVGAADGRRMMNPASS